MEKVKEYSNGENTILWKPAKCIHAAECVRLLPEVYNPDEKPWIKAENATTEALKAQVAKCPSGALSLKNTDVPNPDTLASGTRIDVTESGPLIIMGNLEVKKVDGSIEKKSRATAFCRCGASNNKPYCDGSHSKIGFAD